MYASLRCGLLMLLGAAGLVSTAAAKEPMPRTVRWAAARLEDAGHSVAVKAARLPGTLEKTIRRAGDAGRDFYLTALDFAEIQSSKISAADAPPGQDTPQEYLKRAWERVQASRHDAAMVDVNACLRHAPMHAGAWFLRGEIWFFRKQFYRAVHDFDRAIQYHPFVGNFYEMRARARMALRDKRRALDDASKAILLAPRAALFCFRGLIRKQLGDVEGALDDMNEAIEREPDDAYYLEVRGSVHHDLGDSDAAIADCDRAIELDQEMAAAYFVRAMAKQSKREYDAADADFQIANGLAPESFPLVQSPREPSRATAEDARTGQLRQEEAQFAEQIPIAAFTPFYWQRLAYGRSLSETSPSDKSDTIVAPADPMLARRRNISELCKLAWRAATSPDERYRDGIRAVEAALGACKLSEFNDPWCIEALAAAYAECGEFADAVRYQTQAIELRDEQARFRLGQRPDEPRSPLLDLDDAYRDEQLKRLELYRNHQAYRGER